MIPYGRQDISAQDIAAVVEVLQSDWLTQGPAIPRFEAMLAQYCGAGHAVAVTNATAALHIACAALDLGPGDLLWTSANTFVASANCARYCGADVDFIDIDPRTYNMSLEALDRQLERAKRAGRLPKIVVPVHFAGQPCQMAEIWERAMHYGFRVIEDASHAIGATLSGAPIGAGLFSDICVFSFHPVKIITTGEGGAALTNAPDLAERLRLLRSHGITRNVTRMAPEAPDWYYEQQELGWNYRMTDMQAALGCSQLTRLEVFLQRRRDLAARYAELLPHARLLLPWQQEHSVSSFHLYPIQILGGEGAPARRETFDALRGAGIGVNVHYIPVYLQPYYRAIGFRAGHCPEAERYYERAISLPIFPALTYADQDRIIDAVHGLLQ
jgi:UDP-4-amino-4,6-dideoxy-N-acetyl-beta-L-altrosamine transaminase